MFEGSAINIFDNITEDDIETHHDVLETPDEYFKNCKNMFSKSMFIDIFVNPKKIDECKFRLTVHKLSYILRTLFEMYGIEHSDFILSKISPISSLLEDFYLIDYNSYRQLVLKDGADVGYPYYMMYVYLNYPKMNDDNIMNMFKKMFDIICKINRDIDIKEYTISDMVLYKHVVGFEEFSLDMSKYPHVFINIQRIKQWTNMKSVIAWANDESYKKQFHYSSLVNQSQLQMIQRLYINS